MQLRRLVIAAAGIALVAPAAPATAAKARPPKACFLINDDRGDGRAEGAGSVLSSPVLDVLSADISSGPKEVSGIVRLASAAVDSDNVAKLGVRWNLVYTVQGVKYVFYARYTGYSEGANPQWAGGMTVGGTGEKSSPAATFKRSGDNLVWTVPRAAVPGLKKAKTYLYVDSASSGVLTFGGDAASPKPNTKYLDKSPSCLVSK